MDKMKLDKIRFAKVVALIVTEYQRISENFISELDHIIDIEVIAPAMNVEQLHTLMSIMQRGTNKIDAIKLHRAMTGWGLKESKDAVEDYWRPAETAKTYTKQDLLDRSGAVPLTEVEGSAIDRFINKYLTD
jgi:ribosomal protein L7/L12